MQQKIFAYTVFSLSDCIYCLYFLSQSIRFFCPLVLLQNLFRQEFSSIYLYNVYHKAPYISLYYLLISRLNRGGMEPMSLFFLLSLRLHLRLRFLGSHV